MKFNLLSLNFKIIKEAGHRLSILQILKMHWTYRNVASVAGLKVGLYGFGVVETVVVVTVGNVGRGVGVKWKPGL